MDTEFVRALAPLTDVPFVIEVGDDGAPTMTWASDAFAEMVSVTPEEASRRSLFSFVDPGSMTKAYDAFGALLVGKGASVELRIIDALGRGHLVHIDAHADWDQAGRRVTKIFGRIFELSRDDA